MCGTVQARTQSTAVMAWAMSSDRMLNDHRCGFPSGPPAVSGDGRGCARAACPALSPSPDQESTARSEHDQGSDADACRRPPQPELLDDFTGRHIEAISVVGGSIQYERAIANLRGERVLVDPQQMPVTCHQRHQRRIVHQFGYVVALDLPACVVELDAPAQLDSLHRSRRLQNDSPAPRIDRRPRSVPVRIRVRTSRRPRQGSSSRFRRARWTGISPAASPSRRLAAHSHFPCPPRAGRARA